MPNELTIWLQCDRVGCGFKYEPGIVGVSWCPQCRSELHIHSNRISSLHMSVLREIKRAVDAARAAGICCDYPAVVDIDGDPVSWDRVAEN